MPITVKEIAEFVKGELVGDGRVEITGVSGLLEAGCGEITFIDNPRFKDDAKKTKASCIITSFDVENIDKPVIKCKNPTLAVTKIIESLFPHKINHPRGISKSAFVGKD